MKKDEEQVEFCKKSGTGGSVLGGQIRTIRKSSNMQSNNKSKKANAKGTGRKAVIDAVNNAQDKTDSAKLDVKYQDAKRWNNVNDLVQNLKKAGNRDAYLGAWKEAGGDKAVEALRDAWGDPIYKKFDDAKRDKSKADNERERATIAVNDRKIAIDEEEEFRLKRR